MLIELPEDVSVLQISPFKGDTLTGGEASGAKWHILGQSNDGTQLFRSAQITCPNAAGVELYRLSKRVAATTFVYHDAFDRANAADAASFGDRMAEILWDSIEREGDIPDEPEQYGKLADNHPLDELRTGFLEAADIF